MNQPIFSRQAFERYVFRATGDLPELTVDFYPLRMTRVFSELTRAMILGDMVAYVRENRAELQRENGNRFDFNISSYLEGAAVIRTPTRS